MMTSVKIYGDGARGFRIECAVDGDDYRHTAIGLSQAKALR